LTAPETGQPAETRIRSRIVRVLALVLVCGGLGALAADPPARTFSGRLGEMGGLRSSHAVLAEGPPGEARRSLLEVWTLGSDQILVRTLSPPNQFGNALLFARGRAWSYNHAYRLTARLPRTATPPPAATLILQVAAAAAAPDRFAAIATGAEDLGGALHHRIELRPLSSAGPTGRLEVLVRASDGALVRARSLEPDGTVAAAADYVQLELNPPLDEHQFWLGRLRL